MCSYALRGLTRPAAQAITAGSRERAGRSPSAPSLLPLRARSVFATEIAPSIRTDRSRPATGTTRGERHLDRRALDSSTGRERKRGTYRADLSVEERGGLLRYLSVIPVLRGSGGPRAWASPARATALARTWSNRPAAALTHRVARSHRGSPLPRFVRGVGCWGRCLRAAAAHDCCQHEPLSSRVPHESSSCRTAGASYAARIRHLPPSNA